ncbi:hypothetical protein KY348_01860 [Candidatus Woesearchaeota archaeon]|nr:hypothetical protein [Candidatus Woesearchaeota archaeon]
MAKINRPCQGKKGFALQFNWLFVLIGGAVILGFFISLIVNGLAGEEGITAQKRTEEIDSVLKVSLAAGDTQKTLFFNQKIIFSCDEISEYFVEEAFKYSRYDYNALFSPSELDGRELVILTRVFEAPFRVMPLVYVTNKDIEYVFVGDSGLITQTYNLMPDNATTAAISPDILATYPDKNYDRTVFVLDVNDENSLARLHNFNRAKQDRIFAVVINASEGTVNNYGVLDFYRYEQEAFVLSKSAPFLTLDLALGGIISHDKTMYECNLRKVLQRLEMLGELHMKRMLEIYYENSNDFCQVYYAGQPYSAQEHFESIKQGAEKKELSLDNFRNIFSAINDLRTLNMINISARTDCAPIY